MALAYNHEEITARELKPALYELDGISRETIEAHYKLYQGYVNKRNEILGSLDGVDLGSANQVYSEIRSLKVDLTFAIGGIKNHEVYFRASRRSRRRPQRHLRRSRHARLRQCRRVEGRP